MPAMLHARAHCCQTELHTHGSALPAAQPAALRTSCWLACAGSCPGWPCEGAEAVGACPPNPTTLLCSRDSSGVPRCCCCCCCSTCRPSSAAAAAAAPAPQAATGEAGVRGRPAQGLPPSAGEGAPAPDSTAAPWPGGGERRRRWRWRDEPAAPRPGAPEVTGAPRPPGTPEVTGAESGGGRGGRGGGGGGEARREGDEGGLLCGTMLGALPPAVVVVVLAAALPPMAVPLTTSWPASVRAKPGAIPCCCCTCSCSLPAGFSAAAAGRGGRHKLTSAGCWP